MKKDLHLSTNYEGLEQHYSNLNFQSIRKNSIEKIVLTLIKIRESADKAFLEGDEELSFIFFMKYTYILTELRKFPNYASNKKYVQDMLGTNSTQMIVMDKLEILKKSLEERYAKLNEKKAQVEQPTTQQKSRQNEEKKSISCQELYELLTSSASKYLIMDARPKIEYDTSCIYSQNCVNVPEEILYAGISAGKIRTSLPSDSKELWDSRKNQEMIILIDWSTKNYLNRNSPLWYLHEILENWDPDVEKKPNMYFVDGGYETFKLCYPTKCLNPHYERKTDTSTDVLLDDIEYPSINDIQMKDVSFGSATKSLQATGRPRIDRSSKLNALNSYKEKEAVQILREQDAIAEKDLKVTKDLIEIEATLKTITDQKSVVIDKDEVEKLRAREREYRYQVMQLENQQNDFKSENENLKQQLIEVKSNYAEKIRTNQEQMEKNYNEKIVKELQKQIEEKNQEAEEMKKKLEKERLERERLEKLQAAREQKTNVLNESHSVIRTPKKPSAADELILSPKSLNSIQQPQYDRNVKPVYLSNKQSFYNDQDFAPVYGKVERGLTGLKNLGNTCYMNSIVQCLSNTNQLTEYLLDGIYEKHINRLNKTQGHIIRTVAAVIKMLWSGDCKYISSKHLKAVIGEQENLFYGVDQQDSHEFLVMLIDWMHSDLQTIPLNKIVHENMPATEKAWLEYTNSKESFILHLFYGQIKSTVKCTVCQKESYTYETFSNLSLELPPSNNRCLLEDCLGLYFNGELVLGWNCPTCKEKRNAIKKLDISKLPPILVIHLKRFYADPNTNNSYKKKQNYVDFPIIDLNMLPYVARTEKNNTSNSKHVYHLYAVSNHYGSMESGHYTAYCKNKRQEKWYKYDDHMVTHLDKSDVRSSAGYILFYSNIPNNLTINNR